MEFVHTIQPDCLVNGRVRNHVGDYASTRDNAIPTQLLELDWEGLMQSVCVTSRTGP